jgi:hypothetical protein
VPRRALAAAVASLLQVSPIQVVPPAAIPYSEAKPILERLGPVLPSDLRAGSTGASDTGWADWVSRRDREIRARLERGDEDSVVNLLLFGTTFTQLPRALNDSSKIGGRERAAEIVRGRIADLAAAIASPGTNERLQFVSALVGRRGINPATSAGQAQAQTYFRLLITRMNGEVEGYLRAIQSARGNAELAVRSTLYSTRGLSSDTSIRPDFAIDQTLAALSSKGLLAAGSVRRVGVIGPGLDFTDKAEGYDFYPQQTTQPFAVVDSLRRLGLAHADDFRVITFDLSPRVNMHIEAARERAHKGIGYTLMLPRTIDERWSSVLTAFWKSFGRSIGSEATVTGNPPDGVGARAIAVRPEVVLSIEPRDLNLVLQRQVPAADQDRFDLIVATNVLVYYDVFEQSLALANIASMLRPGGFLLSNNVLVELPVTPMRGIGDTRTIYSDQPDDSDQVIWYQRK